LTTSFKTKIILGAFLKDDTLKRKRAEAIIDEKEQLESYFKAEIKQQQQGSKKI
jgi:hypothetical protein